MQCGLLKLYVADEIKNQNIPYLSRCFCMQSRNGQ